MATILRSSKYIRSLNALVRRTVIAQEISNFASRRLIVQAQCATSYLTKKSYATILAIKGNESCDRMIEKLDDNVQRFGRVFKHEIDSVLSKVRETGRISSQDALLLVRCCGHLLIDIIPEERRKLLNEIWTMIDTLKIPIDVSHFNSLLRVHLDNNTEFSPIEFLTTMRDKGVEPNRITYQRLMLYYCRRGDMEGATGILEFMKEKRLPLNENIFNALIIGHSEANDMEGAKNVLKVMRDADIEPSGGTYTALLMAYAKRGDIASIKETLHEFATKNLYFQDTDYFAVIHVLAANGYTEMIDELLPLMSKGASYNIDASNAIFKILDIGNIDAAMKILPTMNNRNRANEEEAENGVFLIRKLVNAKYPAEEIIKTCETLKNQGENPRAFHTAVERSLLNGNTELSMSLLKGWQKNGAEIREHYFWPILATHGKSCNYQGIIDVVTSMISDFNILPSVETVYEYVLPFTVGKWEDVVSALEQCKIPHEHIVTAIAMRILTDNKPRKTTMFMMSYPITYKPEYFYRPLAEALRVTDDAKYCMNILRLLVESTSSSESENPVETTTTSECISIVDETLRFVLDYLPENKFRTIEAILKHMVEYGLTISPEFGEEIRTHLKDNINPITSEMIDKLTSGNLKLIPIVDLAKINEADTEFRIRESDTRQRSIFASKRRELNDAIKNENIEEAAKLIKDLESRDFIFSPALCAQIIDLYCSVGDMEQAEKWMNKVKSEAPNVMLDMQKTTDYAAMLIKNDRFDEAIQCIRDSPRRSSADHNASAARRVARGLLSVAAETGDVERTNQLFDALVDAHYILIDNYSLRQLIKVHIVRNDLQSALAVFENACQEYRCTPLKNELSIKFIDNEDASSLQRLTDLSTEIHGESNSLIDLVLAFIECGRLRQARKILETPGLRFRGKKLKDTINRHSKDHENDFLDQFIEITKGLPLIDRQELYDHLIKAYNDKDNWQRGLSLWTMIQDEDIQPSNSFLKYLAELLKRNDQPVPFQFNDVNEVKPNASENDELNHEKFKSFHDAIENKNLSEAESIARRVSSDEKEFGSAMSMLIIEYAKGGEHLDKSCKLVEELMANGRQVPSVPAMNALWNGFRQTKQFDKLRQLGNVLSPIAKQKLRFNKYLVSADIEEMGLDKYVENFFSKITDSRDNNIQLVRNELNFSAIVGSFGEHPSALKKFEDAIEKFAEQQIHFPISMVWTHYLEYNKPEAEVIWAKHLKKSNRVMYRYLIRKSFQKNDIELMERLYKQISTSVGLSGAAIANVFSALITVYDKNGRIDDALNAIERTSTVIVKQCSTLHPKMFKIFEQRVKASGKSLPSKLDDKKQRSDL